MKIKLATLMVMTVLAGQNLAAAQAEAKKATEVAQIDAKQTGAQREYSKEQQAVIKTLVQSLNQCGTDAEWPKRKELIRQAIERDGIHPDDFAFNILGKDTALFQAVLHSDQEFVRYLLEHGADPNKSAFNHVLFVAKDEATAKLLLDKGANPNCVREDGVNLLFQRKTLENPRLALIYFCAGTNPRLLNRDGISILSNALIQQTNTRYLAPLFVKMGAPFLSPTEGEFAGESFEQILKAGRLISKHERDEILKGIDLAQDEFDEADASRIAKERELPAELAKCIPIPALTALVLAYDNKNEWGIPPSLLREIEAAGLTAPVQASESPMMRRDLGSPKCPDNDKKMCLVM